MSNPFAYKSADEISAMWQSAALRGSAGKMQHVLFIAMVNEYTGVTHTSWLTLLRMIIPGFEDISRPFLIGYAKVMPSGRVVSEAIDHDGVKRLHAVYRSKDEFISEMRRLADRLKLNDIDRVEMFALLGKWIVADYRIGVHGEKLAS